MTRTPKQEAATRLMFLLADLGLNAFCGIHLNTDGSFKIIKMGKNYGW